MKIYDIKQLELKGIVLNEDSKYFTLQLLCKENQWKITKRYTQFREFRNALCALVDGNTNTNTENITDTSQSMAPSISAVKQDVALVKRTESMKMTCVDRCHYLRGIEKDRFPRKLLIHSKSILESRLNTLSIYIRNILCRLTLSDEKHLLHCIHRQCPVLRLIVNFFEFPLDDMSPEEDKKMLSLLEKKEKDMENKNEEYEKVINVHGSKHVPNVKEEEDEEDEDEDEEDDNEDIKYNDFHKNRIINSRIMMEDEKETNQDETEPIR